METLTEGWSSAPERWRVLFETSPDARIHHHPDYVPLALPRLGRDAWTISYGSTEESQTMAIFIPKRVKFGRQLLPGAASSLVGVRLAGFGLLGHQCDGSVSEIVGTLAREMRRRAIPVVEFEEIEEDSLLWRNLQRLSSHGFRFAASTNFDAHHRIRFPDSAEEYWSRFKSKTRNSLRRKRKKLGVYDVRRSSTVGDVDDLLDAAHRVSLNSWQSHQLGLRIHGSDTERKYLRFLSENGALRSYVLSRDGDPIAFVLSHQWRGVYYYDELGFDRRTAHLSPGNVLLQEIIDDLLATDRPHTLDFRLGDADYKKLFANESSSTAKVWMFAPGPRSYWQSVSIALRENCLHAARATAERFGVATRLRRHLRDRVAR